MDPQHPYVGLEPAEVWRHFAALNAIPRPSKQEDQALDYTVEQAAAHGAAAARDSFRNVVIRVPATPGCEGAPAVVVQAHLDMVCEKRPGVEHDFTKDPIRPRREGDRIYATGTTLGADNGIGAACALALLTDQSLRHGPLELLFTVEEETGLHGARELDPSLISARLMVNLDSEDPRELTVGCAGGAGATLKLDLETTTPPARWLPREIVVSGLKGGHSGVQIHEPLANAIKLLLRALRDARGVCVEFALSEIRGGNAHNAIPRDATARLVVSPDGAERLDECVARTAATLNEQWLKDEPGFKLEIRPLESAPDVVLTQGAQNRLLDLLHRLPHGPLHWSEAFAGKVETSANLAQVGTALPNVTIGTSTRSFVEAELDKVQAEIAAAASAAGAEIDVRDGYPGWEPDAHSQLLEVTRAVYEREFSTPPEVQVIHAGLECGVIVSKLPGMEAISFGPHIGGAHTPEEYVQISTVETTWRLLTALLAELCAG